MTKTPALDAMSEPRRTLLSELKQSGALAISDLAGRLGVSYEAARQQVGQLELEGFVARRVGRDGSARGRPRTLFQLSRAGEHLFPKEYDALAVALIDAAAERLGPAGLADLLRVVAQRKIDSWRPRLEGKDLPERLEALRSIYAAEDPHCTVEAGDDGTPRLVELNCPYLEVAERRPALCSVTVSVLRSLLGREVVRTERFQNGDGRCVFRVGSPVTSAKEPEPFAWEPEATD